MMVFLTLVKIIRNIFKSKNKLKTMAEKKVPQLSSETILAKYAKADKAGRKLLEELYGVELFAPNLLDQINGLDDALKITGDKMEEVIPFANPINEYQECMNAKGELIQMVKAATGNWIPDFADTNQPKWEPIFQWNSSVSAFRFWFSLYDLTHANAISGARLVFPSQEMSDKFGKKFTELYNKVLTKKS